MDRKEYNHTICIASIAVGKGFTIFDGRTSTSYDSGNYSKIYREIVEKGVRLLYVGDKKTWNTMRDIFESRPMMGNVKIVKLIVTDKYCAFCHSKRCHRWLAVECLSQALKFFFDHINHS